MSPQQQDVTFHAAPENSLANTIAQSPSSEPTSPLIITKFPRFMEPPGLVCLHNNMPIIRILSQINPLHTFS